MEQKWIPVDASKMLKPIGKCCSPIEAIELFESLIKIVPEEYRTHKFCEEYECALNRIRYEASKGVGRKKKITKSTKSWRPNLMYCGNCGFDANDPMYEYCPKCGTRYLEEFEREKKEKFVERCQNMHKDKKTKKKQCDGQMSLEV